MKIKQLSLLILCITISGYSAFSFAENYMYKWKSADGETHYTERPPAKGIAFQKIRVNESTISPPQKPSKPVLSQENTPDEVKAEELYSGWRKENCTRAVKNLEVLESAGRIAQDDGQGGTRLMTDEEKKEKIKQMTEQKEKYCTEEQK